MILYPAIDLRQGQVVRLREGDPARQTVFSSDPVATARRWLDQGAQWLHVVNLDGAFGETSVNLQVLERLAALGAPVQFGGGIRSLSALQAALAAGARRVVIGTAAVEQPELLSEALEHAGSEGVAVALDARDGQIATRGWQHATQATPESLGREMASRGVRHALFTDISRDGLLAGANHQATIALASQTGLQVIASGGIASLEEIRLLAASGQVAGAVVGMALYEGRLTLSDALTAAQGA